MLNVLAQVSEPRGSVIVKGLETGFQQQEAGLEGRGLRGSTLGLSETYFEFGLKMLLARHRFACVTKSFIKLCQLSLALASSGQSTTNDFQINRADVGRSVWRVCLYPLIVVLLFLIVPPWDWFCYW